MVMMFLNIIQPLVFLTEAHIFPCEAWKESLHRAQLIVVLKELMRLPFP